MIPADRPFRTVAEKYRASGFLGTLALPPAQKSPPPKGYTGNGRPYPSDEDVSLWRKQNATGNIALRLAEVPPEFVSGREDLPPIYAGNNVDGWELIGIDADNYTKGEKPKHGADELRQLEDELGQLPATALSGARFDTGSCIAVYLVPKGYRFMGKPTEAIEIIQKRHRYMVAYPSLNPDALGQDGQPAMYEWGWGAPSKLAETGADGLERFDGGIPALADVTLLPEAWFRYLSHGGQNETEDPISDLTPPELVDWLQSQPGYGGEMCRVMQRAVNDWVVKIKASSNSHDMIRNAQWRVLCLAAEGHAGVNAALDAIGEAGYPAALGKRDIETLGSEVGRSVIGALDKIQPRYAMANGRTYLPEDRCAVDLSRFDCDGWSARLKAYEVSAAGAWPGRFRLVTASELAAPVEPMRWLIRGIWPERSAGVLAGDKKSLKTWNLQALALAVASGRALFDKYHVTSPGPVLYLSGEGGLSTFANRHQVLAERYGITDRLSDLKFGADFGVGTLGEAEFTDAVKRHLDELQPKLVILDPLYAYHPRDVEVQNVYARGPMLAGLRELIGGESALIVGDHFNKTAGKGLDLDNIAQAGMGQWADSWILQKHREIPNLDGGKFWLEVQTGSRRGGGKHLEIDWALERDNRDPDAITWSGVDWESRSAGAKSAGGMTDGTVEAILQVVADHPYELTESAVLKEVGGKRDKAREVFAGLKANGGVVIKNCAADEGGRQVSRDRVGLGENAERLRRNRYRQEQLRSAVEATDTDEGTGSEQVAADE